MISRATIFVLVLVIAGLLLAGYSLQLAEANEYIGYVAFPIDFSYLLIFLSSVCLITVLVPRGVSRPSDFFIFLYCIFVLLPYSTLFPIRMPVSFSDFLYNFFVLAAPVFLIKLTSLIRLSIYIPQLISEKFVTLAVVAASLVGLLIASVNSPESAGFDLLTSYDRRLEARDTLVTGGLAAYVVAASINGFGPFLAFLAGWHNKIWLFLFSLFCGVGFYYLYGVKAPLLIIAVAYLIGFMARTKSVRGFVAVVLTLLVCMLSFFIIEYYFFGYSIVGDYLIRRAFSVPPFIASAFFDFMNSNGSITWSAFTGVDSAEPITFFIGEVFLNSPGLNANTNAFLYQLAANGFPYYIITMLLVSIVYIVLDMVYISKRQVTVLYLGFIYAILLTEQAATTALLSSGVGFLILLTLFSKPNLNWEKEDLFPCEIDADLCIKLI